MREPVKRDRGKMYSKMAVLLNPPFDYDVGVREGLPAFSSERENSNIIRMKATKVLGSVTEHSHQTISFKKPKPHGFLYLSIEV